VRKIAEASGRQRTDDSPSIPLRTSWQIATGSWQQDDAVKGRDGDARIRGQKSEIRGQKSDLSKQRIPARLA
jgi:hypothetical protein